DATFYLGRFARREIELEGVRLTLVSGDFGEEVLGPLLELTQRTLREASAMLGPPRGASVLIGYERAERGVDGGVIGDAIAIRSDRILEPRAYRAEGRVLVHELAHLFNQSPDYWAQEGLTRYLELLLRARLDGLSEDLAFDGLMGSYAAYREGVGARAIGEATPSMGSWPYEAGAVFGFCVDTHLRERGSSLLEAHRAARQAGAWPIPAEALLDAIEARSAPSGAYARALLMRRGGVDFGACLRRAGRSLRASPYLALGAEAIERVLRADRNLSFPPTIGRPYPASGFQAGDRLLEAAGVPITALDELGWALQGRAFDESVRFRILRQGSRRIVQQRLPNLRALGEEAFRFHAVPNEGAPAAASPFARTE
ncbi:MAG: hypothetical protein OEY14_16185, partial [Myxococcales bacterium]|nr:hypothetical protein [Myxococcales bacterium]